MELIFQGGNTQKLELEHSWNSYIDHGHQNNSAFKNVWIFAEEKFNFAKIFRIFSGQKEKNNDRIPDVFLGFDENNKRCVYRINWKNKKFEDLNFKF